MKHTKSVYLILLFILAAVSVLLCFEKAPQIPKRFSGINIIFFNGGSSSCPFTSVVHKGALAAEKDLGCHVRYVWSDWDPRKMALQFKEAIDKKPDAICMMGHPGTDVLGPLVDEAVRKGIVITLQNVDIPELRVKYAEKGLGYAGQVLYSSGTMLGSGVVKKFKLGKGIKAAVIGPGITEDKKPLTERAVRTKGCIDALEQGGLTVYAVPASLELENDPAGKGPEVIAKIFAEHPDLKVLITDHGSLTSSIGKTLKKLGKNPGDIIVAGFDLSADTVAAIKEGYVGLVHDQQPFLQGYLPIVQVCLAKKYGFSGLYVDTGVGLIDGSNVESIEALVLEQIR
jgi:simple sugar transport system substrate-binding protein